MAEIILRQYKSRRNRAVLVQTEKGTAVVKTFSAEEAFQKELQIYERLRNTDIPCAQVLSVRDNMLMLSCLPGKNLVECLQQQEERKQPLWDVWDQLAAWLISFHRQTGLGMTDVNLRNFIYDENTKTLYGLDFEECSPCDISIPAARAAAFIRTYKPENTPLKQEISRYLLRRFAEEYEMEVEALTAESARQEAILLTRRKK